MPGMLEGSVYGIKVNVEMIHHKDRRRYDAKVCCPVCSKQYASFNQTVWTAAKNSAVDKLRTHYNSRHK